MTKHIHRDLDILTTATIFAAMIKTLPNIFGIKISLLDVNIDFKYQPAPGALAHHLQHSPPATPHRLLNPKWLSGSGNRSNPMLLDLS